MQYAKKILVLFVGFFAVSRLCFALEIGEALVSAEALSRIGNHQEACDLLSEQSRLGYAQANLLLGIKEAKDECLEENYNDACWHLHLAYKYGKKSPEGLYLIATKCLDSGSENFFGGISKESLLEESAQGGYYNPPSRVSGNSTKNKKR